MHITYIYICMNILYYIHTSFVVFVCSTIITDGL